MSTLKFSVFPSRKLSDGTIVLIPNMRIIRGTPPLGDRIAERMDDLERFGRDMISPFQEIIFTQLADGSTLTSYAEVAQLPGMWSIGRN